MIVSTPCPTCPEVHRTRAVGRPGEKYTAEPEPCLACAEVQARRDRAETFAGGGR